MLLFNIGTRSRSIFVDTGGQLKGLAKAGMITPDTIVETEEGKSAPARKVKGLTFVAAQSETEQSESPQSVPDVPSSSEPSPFTVAPTYENHPVATTVPDQAEQPVSSPPTSTQLFCTNCGQPVTEQAFACMSCGADPRSHRKFCRHCGVALNPEQIVCIKCGAGVGSAVAQSTEGGATIDTETTPIINTPQATSSTALMWMHWSLPFFPLASLIIWSIIKDKVPHATTHGKHILNAFLTMMIYNIPLLVFAVIGFMLASIGMENENTALVLVSAFIMLLVVCLGIFIVIIVIVYAIRIGIAAEKGEILSYKWAWRFIKTDSHPEANTHKIISPPSSSYFLWSIASTVILTFLLLLSGTFLSPATIVYTPLLLVGIIAIRFSIACKRDMSIERYESATKNSARAFYCNIAILASILTLWIVGFIVAAITIIVLG